MSKSSFRDLVETISRMSEKEEPFLCPLCDESPCECDDHIHNPKPHEGSESNIEETATPQVMAKALASPQEAPNAVKVFIKLKQKGVESLNNDDRLEAAKILQMLIPTISEDDLFARINNDMIARAKVAQTNAAQAANTEANPEAEVAADSEPKN